MTHPLVVSAHSRKSFENECKEYIKTTTFVETKKIKTEYYDNLSDRGHHDASNQET